MTSRPNLGFDNRFEGLCKPPTHRNRRNLFLAILPVSPLYVMRFPTLASALQPREPCRPRHSRSDGYTGTQTRPGIRASVLAAVLVNALHPALEDAEIAFDGNAVDRGIDSIDILTGAMRRSAMISADWVCKVHNRQNFS